MSYFKKFILTSLAALLFSTLLPVLAQAQVVSTVSCYTNTNCNTFGGQVCFSGGSTSSYCALPNGNQTTVAQVLANIPAVDQGACVYTPTDLQGVQACETEFTTQAQALGYTASCTYDTLSLPGIPSTYVPSCSISGFGVLGSISGSYSPSAIIGSGAQQSSWFTLVPPGSGTTGGSTAGPSGNSGSSGTSGNNSGSTSSPSTSGSSSPTTTTTINGSTKTITTCTPVFTTTSGPTSSSPAPSSSNPCNSNLNCNTFAGQVCFNAGSSSSYCALPNGNQTTVAQVLANIPAVDQGACVYTPTDLQGVQACEAEFTVQAQTLGYNASCSYDTLSLPGIPSTYVPTCTVAGNGVLGAISGSYSPSAIIGSGAQQSNWFTLVSSSSGSSSGGSSTGSGSSTGGSTQMVCTSTTVPVTSTTPVTTGTPSSTSNSNTVSTPAQAQQATLNDIYNNSGIRQVAQTYLTNYLQQVGLPADTLSNPGGVVVGSTSGSPVQSPTAAAIVSPVTITSLSPSTGQSGTVIVVSGKDFSTTSTVLMFGSQAIGGLGVSPDGTNFSFIAPFGTGPFCNIGGGSGCANLPVPNGQYQVEVVTPDGTSVPVNFTVAGSVATSSNISMTAAQFPATVTVTSSTLNVRSAPNTSAALAGSQTLSQGDQFTAVQEVIGQSVDGQSLWFVSSKGNYVWAGGASISAI